MIIVNLLLKKENNMEAKDFRNNSKMVFENITDELYRVYVFPDMEIKITEPLFLNVSKSGGHRVLDSAGNSNYIPSGWRRIYWLVKDGRSHFAF